MDIIPPFTSQNVIKKFFSASVFSSIVFCNKSLYFFIFNNRDLKNNLISAIDPGAFIGLASLKRL